MRTTGPFRLLVPLLLAILGGTRASAQPWSDPGAGAGLRLSSSLGGGAEGWRLGGGVHYRTRLTGGLGVEAALEVRPAAYTDGPDELHVLSLPLTAAILLFPLSNQRVQPYLLAGAGYYLVKLRGTGNLSVWDGTENLFAFAVGAGVESIVTPDLSIFADGRYHFLAIDALEKVFETPGGYFEANVGVTWHF